MSEMNDTNVWLASLQTAADVAEEAYTSLRNSWPGQRPKWLRQHWHQLPTDFRVLLINIAERAGMK